MRFKYLYIFTIILMISIGCKDNSSKEKQDVTVGYSADDRKQSISEDLKYAIDYQIGAAVLAAPIEARENAKVYGYDENGNLITLREGDNNFICIADDPNKKGFEVVCYHNSLEPFMSRGRVLNKEGKSRNEKEAIRESEAISGKLSMPHLPAALHILQGENAKFDKETGDVKDAKYRYVVYIPFATQETTGLNLKPNAQGHPWLMFAGKYNAHIMISPSE